MYIFFKNLFECEVWRLFNKVYYFNVLRVVIVIEYLLKNEFLWGKKWGIYFWVLNKLE